MNDLATLADFASNDAPIYAAADTVAFWVRSVSVFLLLVMSTAPWGEQGVDFWRGLAFGAALAAFAGLVVATFGHLVTQGRRRRALWRRLERIFAGDQAIVPPAPPHATDRLVCVLRLSPKERFGGILYVTPTDLRFQPNYGFRSFWRRKPSTPFGTLVIGPPSTIVLTSGYLVQDKWWRRLLGHKDIPALGCTWATGSAIFRVPEIERTTAALQHCVDRLRAAAVAAV